MPWKVDENEIIAVDNGNPVWIYEGGEKDGQEAPVAFDNTLKTISRLTAESTDRETKLNEAKAKLAPIEAAGIENFEEFYTNANKAIDTVANLGDKEILDAGGVDKIKQGVKDSYEHRIKSLTETHLKEMEKLSGTIKGQDSIRGLVIRNAFDQSEFLREKTVLTPDLAYSHFGTKFDVEIVDGKPVGYAKDSEGNKLISLKNPGENADPLEAIELLINSYPQKDKILRMDSNGNGTPVGGPGRSSGKDLLGMYNEAKKNRNVQQMTALKNQMHAAKIPVPL